MNLGEILRTSVSEIRHHKLRSSLTLLGIVLGTLSITVMTSLLSGVTAAVWAGFTDLGYDGVVIVVQQPPRDSKERAIFTRSRGLMPEDVPIIMGRRQIVAEVAAVQEHEAIIKGGGIERKARVLGVTPSFATVRNRQVAAGRFLNDADEASFARVCIIGRRLRAYLFGTEDPLGRTVAIAGRPFVVVGIGKKLGNRFVNDSDFVEEMEGVIIPLSTMRKFYAGDESPLSYLAVRTREVERLGDLEAEVKASLTLAHRGATDFRVENIAEEILRFRKQAKVQLRNWQIVLGAIAGVSLLVGGIGLFSVMLIAIGERLYEIGLRKAIGATELQVFLQFFSEATALSLLGGFLGCVLGVGVTKLVEGKFAQGLPIHLDGLALALLIALVLGGLSGLYPAIRASRLEPVEALRSAA
jgi:putative ABC transport system permease protein